MPSASDLLNSFDKGDAIKMAVNFKSFTGMLSGPVDLLASREFRICRTSLSDVVILSRVGTGEVSVLRIAVCKSVPLLSVLVCPAKNSFRRVAFV